MLDTILEESNNTDIAVVWAINAKNSLTNVHGFSTGNWSKPYFTLCCHKQATGSHTYPNQQNSRRKFTLPPQVKTGNHSSQQDSNI